MPEPRTYRWILDARASFPYSPRSAKQSTQSWSQSAAVSSALGLVSEPERAKILRYHFPQDAALSLSSALLKRYAVVHMLQVPWKQSEISQDRTVQNGKPYYAPGGIEFNVSHHGEAAVLIATTVPGAKVGIDLTHVDMDKDMARLRKSGFDAFVDVFAEVFSPAEVRDMLLARPAGVNPAAASTEDMVAALCTFYSYWALKEAYFKMTGDALLADWLKDLEFSHVVAPLPSRTETGSRTETREDQNWRAGQPTWAGASLKGEKIEDVKLELRGLGELYVVATSTTGMDALPPFQVLDVSRDILPLAQ